MPDMTIRDKVRKALNDKGWKIMYFCTRHKLSYNRFNRWLLGLIDKPREPHWKAIIDAVKELGINIEAE